MVLLSTRHHAAVSQKKVNGVFADTGDDAVSAPNGCARRMKPMNWRKLANVISYSGSPRPAIMAADAAAIQARSVLREMRQPTTRPS